MTDSYKNLKKAFVEAIMEDVDNWEDEYKKNPMSPEQMVGRSQYQKMSDEEKLAAERKYWKDNGDLELDHDMIKDMKLNSLIRRAYKIINDYEDGLLTYYELLTKLADLGRDCAEVSKEYEKYAPYLLDISSRKKQDK